MKRKNISLARRLRKGQTETEKVLWYKLRNRQVGGFKFRRQYTIGNYIADFVCLEKKFIIELDGSGHVKDETRIYDSNRTRELDARGYTIIRFWNNEVMHNLDEVLEIILYNLTNPHPNLLP